MCFHIGNRGESSLKINEISQKKKYSWINSNKNSFFPRGLKLSLFSLYGQRFPRYGPIFKIAIFGHETWPLAKVPEVAHILPFYPRGSKFSSFFALRAAVSEIGAYFQNCYIEAWKFAILAKVPEVEHVYTLFLPHGVNIDFIFILRAAVSEIWANFQTCHIWAWNLAMGQSSRSCTYDMGQFSNMSYLGMKLGHGPKF